MSKVEQWEYMIKFDDAIHMSNIVSTTAFLDHGGNQGWELVSCYPLHSATNVYIFKRLKTKQPSHE
jgi:hypothetical protein